MLSAKAALITAIIPARGGSKGVPGKNIRNIAGFPLIAYSIAAAKLCGSIGRVVISTDSEKIASIGKKFGAKVPFLRPVRYARDNSTDLEFVLHAINWFRDNEARMPDYLVHLRPTTPLRDPAIVDRAVGAMVGNRKATSLRSGHPAPESPFKWFTMNKRGYFTGIQPGCSNESCNMPRQTFPVVYVPDGYVDILKTSCIVKSGKLHGERMLGFVSPVCTEVDTIGDFEYLEFEIKKKGSQLLAYLKKTFGKNANVR